MIIIVSPLHGHFSLATSPGNPSTSPTPLAERMMTTPRETRRPAWTRRQDPLMGRHPKIGGYNRYNPKLFFWWVRIETPTIFWWVRIETATKFWMLQGIASRLDWFFHLMRACFSSSNWYWLRLHHQELGFDLIGFYNTLDQPFGKV